MFYWSPLYDPEREKQKRKLKKDWTKFVSPTWQGGQQKLDQYIRKKVIKGVFPPQTTKHASI